MLWKLLIELWAYRIRTSFQFGNLTRTLARLSIWRKDKWIMQYNLLIRRAIPIWDFSPSVCPTVLLCWNGCTHRQHLSSPDRSIILDFSSPDGTRKFRVKDRWGSWIFCLDKCADYLGNDTRENHCGSLCIRSSRVAFDDLILGRPAPYVCLYRLT